MSNKLSSGVLNLTKARDLLNVESEQVKYGEAVIMSHIIRGQISSEVKDKGYSLEELFLTYVSSDPLIVARIIDVMNIRVTVPYAIHYFKSIRARVVEGELVIYDNDLNEDYSLLEILSYDNSVPSIESLMVYLLSDYGRVIIDSIDFSKLVL